MVGCYCYRCYFEFNLNLGLVHTNPFSNENGAVLLRFQKDLRPLSFSYRFRPSILQRRIRFDNAFITSVRMLKWTRRMRISINRPAKLAPFWILMVGDRFRRCSVDDSRIRSKTAPFSFENGLVWTGPYRYRVVFARPHACSNELDACALQYISPRNWRHSAPFSILC